MSYVYHYDFDSKRSGCNLEIEIHYEKDEVERITADYRTYDLAPCLDLIHVNVTAIEGYDKVGEIEIDEDWLCDLERYALQWVEDQIDYCGGLADELWENPR
ncbi:MAG: hypothetical protein ACYS7Y_24875 [Planctomycetota bacterium]|jgi:hypothetical protein